MNSKTIETIINASPKATLLTDRKGGILCINTAARALLFVAAVPASLFELFEPAQQLTSSVRNALRSSGSVPVLVHQRGQGTPWRMRLQPLRHEGTDGGAWLLITLQSRTAANEQMLELKRRLGEETAERRRLKEQNNKLRRTVAESIPRLKALAHTDVLTGSFNRRYFDAQYAREWRRSVRQQGTLSLIYIDIDHFKAYNDAYGHPQGDECLKRVARALESALSREFDVVSRIGGEEFAVLLPMTPAAGAIELAQRLLDAVRNENLPHPLADWPVVSISVGVGTCTPTPDDSPADFIRQVDEALYRAKRSGRNRLAALPGMPALGGARLGTGSVGK